MYYNTVPISGEDLKDKQEKALTQEQIILDLFKKHKRFSPFQLYRRNFAGKAPITSVRRAITELTKSGFLRKTGVRVQGMYPGSVENVWELNDNQLKLL